MIESGNVVRTARKPWACFSERAHRLGWAWAVTLPEGHEPTIQRGARYVESMDNAPGYQSGDRYCLACAQAFCGWHPEPQSVDAAAFSGADRPTLGGAADAR